MKTPSHWVLVTTEAHSAPVPEMTYEERKLFIEVQHRTDNTPRNAAERDVIAKAHYRVRFERE